jgi:hypothetical protein
MSAASASGLNPNTVAFLNFYDITGKSLFILGEDILFKGGSFGGFDPCVENFSEDIVMIWDNGVDRASSRITFDGDKAATRAQAFQ